MNIFEHYLSIIKKLITIEAKNEKIILPENLDGITVEMPPSKFNCDLSSNVCMFLGKSNKKSPMILGEQIKKLLLDIEDIDVVKIEKPGFLNVVKFNSIANSFKKIIALGGIRNTNYKKTTIAI